MSELPEGVPPGSGRLGGRRALVVGAGASAPGWGIGRAIAARFAAEGAAVLAFDRDAEALEETARLIALGGGRCETITGDATRPDDLLAAAERAAKLFGGLDILVNNVGGGGSSGIGQTTPEAWRAALDFNLSSAFYATQAAMPLLLASGSGAVVHVASIAGLRHIGADTMAYGVAKAGLLHLSRLIAMEYAGRVRSNCVAPGLIDTAEIRRRACANFGEENEAAVRAIRASTVPSRTLGTPWDIAAAALYLASDEAAYVTGAEIVADGGAVVSSIPSYLDEARARFGKGAQA